MLILIEGITALNVFLGETSKYPIASSSGLRSGSISNIYRLSVFLKEKHRRMN